MLALVPVEIRPRERVVERRMFLRRWVEFVVEARRLDHSLEAHRYPRIMLLVQDLSLNGLSGHSDLPLHVGERVSFYLPPQPGMRGWQAFGRVSRCEPTGERYEVGIAFAPLPAA